MVYYAQTIPIKQLTLNTQEVIVKTFSLIAVVIALFITSINVPASAQQADGNQVAQAASPSMETTSLTEVIRKHVPDVPVLPDINITPPDPSVPTEVAGLSGVWVGEFRGGSANVLMAHQVLAFERISPLATTMVSSGIGRYVGGRDQNYGRTWSGRREAKVRADGEKIVVTDSKGNVYLLSIKQDGRLHATVTGPGLSWVGTLEKVR
ncbi:MAG: hypothetical protein Q7R69_00585 [bacterium]|nr:hypothetical protein [bacterium]